MQEVTIILPVYNRATYLARLFRSLEGVTYEALRVILVDNGSTDDSQLLCRQFAEQSHLKVDVIVEPRKGAARARNAGLKACQTEWCYFFDSDDEVSSDFLDEVVPILPGHDVVFMPTRMIVGEREVVRSYKDTLTPSYQILSSMLCTPSTLYRTEWLRGIGGWDDSLTVWDDWELGVRVLLARPRAVWYTRKAFHRLYVHDESITGPSMQHNLKGKVACLEQVRRQLKDRRDLKALYLRTKIFEGYLRKEGYQEKIHVMDAPSLTCKLCGAFLRLYVRCGGKGAWWMATMM